MTNTAYRIVRRAFGEFTEIEVVEGWLAAQLRAMELEANRKDGEYLTRKIGEGYHRDGSNNQCPVQAAFAYL